ncbi:MAG TPA: metallophosphoesterase family protein [Longimicrobiales bacterium]|nr:metallophosphoesterase family protein [Longimicrobiales bacterium]
MLNLLQISDLHFGPYFKPAVAESLLEKIEELEADILINSGDLTQRAKRIQFEDARAFHARLPKVPTVVVPGNHDVPLYRVMERIFSPYALYQEHISEELNTVLHHERAVIVALNSTSPLRAITNGRIRRWQLDLCSEVFRNVPENVLRVVVAHHHFAPAPDYEGGQVMPRAQRAMDRFTELKVDLVLGGHMHRAYIGNSLDVYSGRDREHGVIIVQSGTSASRRGRAREREKNSFNYVQVGDDIIRVTHYMYFADIPGFQPVSRHIFPRMSRHYLSDAPAQIAGHRAVPRDADLAQTLRPGVR